MQKFLAKKINSIRNPFRLHSLPLMGMLCKYWFDNITNRRKKIQAKMARALFIYMKRLGFKSKGLVEVVLSKEGEQGKVIEFNASNTQFQAFYLERYRDVYEMDVAMLIDLLVSNEGCFYDVGSNFGYFSIYIASRQDFKGEVHAFELSVDNYVDLKKMVYGSGLQHLIHMHNIGIYSKKDVIFISKKRIISGNCSVEDAVPEKSSGVGCSIVLDRLDKLNIKEPDVLKVDVEGVELDVFKGCDGFLGKKKPFIIFESCIEKERKATIAPIEFLLSKDFIIFYVLWARPLVGKLQFFSTDGFSFRRGDYMVLKELKDINDRFDLAERLNLLACHKDRLDELKCIFSDVITEYE